MPTFYLKDNPKFVKEWDYEKNENLEFSLVTSGSSLRAWWIGDCSHSWSAVVNRRVNKGTGCPYCSGTKILKGFNDFGTTHPDIASEWHPTKNVPLLPSDVKASCKNKFWWLGKICSHEFYASPSDRFHKNSNCSVCSGKQVMVGVNDLASLRPELLEEWDFESNVLLSPYEVSEYSQKRANWVCKEGHKWEAVIGSRSKKDGGRGCPYCGGFRSIVGINDLATTHPELASEWHPTLNGDLKPSNLGAGSGKKVWWQCEKGHEWKVDLNNRTAANSGCPFCANKRTLKGFNDLATTHPLIASEWHPTKNGIKTSSSITYGYGEYIWWQCSRDSKHMWETSPKDRAHGQGCPACWSTTFVSKPEKDLLEFLTSLGLEVEATVKNIVKRQELDLYIPDRKVAVEYNGLYWHSEVRGKGRWYHHNKWSLCKEQGIQLIQVWEDDWNRNPELVKNMLAYKLGVSRQDKVFARKTVVVKLAPLEASTFLDEFHIQGAVTGSVRLGLKVEESSELVAVMVLSKVAGSEGKSLNLTRFASAQPVIGGFSKLLKAVNVMFPDVTSIVTFSDNTVSDGGLYASNGFAAVKELRPDYMYVVDGVRQHKFGYRLVRFKSDPNLKFKHGLPESELAKLNKLLRIWDAGKIKWEFKL